MSWNFRIVDITCESRFAIEAGSKALILAEVYYDKDGNPDSYAVPVGESALVVGESTQEIAITLERMRFALDKAVLIWDNEARTLTESNE